LHVSAQPYQLLGEPSLVYEPAKDALALADEYGFAVWRAHGLIERGWALAELGSPQDGIEMMKKGLAEYEATGAKLRSPYFLGLLADQLGKTGRVVEGLTVITDAITLAQNTGEGYGLPELHRIKLFLKSRLSQSAKLLSDSPALETVSQARACFAETLETSKQQGARWRQLKAALSVYRLEMQYGRPDRAQLAEMYSSFTEGHETADLKEAKALLDAVPSRSTD